MIEIRTTVNGKVLISALIVSGPEGMKIQIRDG
mgnify:FL=1